MSKCAVCGERPPDNTDMIVGITVLLFIFCVGYYSYRYHWILMFLQDSVGIWPDIATLEVVNGLVSIVLIVSGVFIIFYAILSMFEK